MREKILYVAAENADDALDNLGNYVIHEVYTGAACQIDNDGLENVHVYKLIVRAERA